MSKAGQRIKILFLAWTIVALQVVQHRSACAAVSESQATKFGALLKQCFKKWDFDRDGVLTADELDQVIQDPSIKGDQAAALSAVKVYSRGAWSKADLDDAFTLEQLSPFDPTTGEITSSGKKLVSLFTVYQKKIAQSSPQLFSSGTPHIEEIKQGKTGDCYFLSTVGGLVYHSPQRIIDMIQQDQDGSYLVTFPRHKPIAVDAPTDAEIACYSDAGDDGLWLHVLEKAYATYKNNKTRKDLLEPLDLVIHGGSGGRMLMFMTGDACVRYPTSSTSDDELRSELVAALQHKRIVNTGTSGHCLTILNFDPSTDQVTVWNPWGTTGTYSTVHQEMNHGVFSMPLADLKKYFVSILPQQSRPWTTKDFEKFE